MTGVPKTFFDSLPDLAQASCKDIEEKEFFFPSDHQLADRLEELRSICRSCPEIAKCLQFALNQNIATGFWGGKTTKERRKLAKANALPRSRTSRVMERGPLILQMRADGATYEEIGRHFDISETAAIQTVVRYRKKMKEMK